MTQQRKEILNLIRTAPGHLSAEEVFFLVKQRLPNIAMATVYNNLNFLSQNGFISKIKLYGEADRYDKRVTPHDHLICDRCGAIRDISTDDFVTEFEKKHGIEVLSYELNIHYICEDCKHSAQPAPDTLTK